MEGKVVVITSATSGLGLAAADGFARLGATVWLAVRNRDRAEDARARMLEHRGEADVHVELCDLSRVAIAKLFQDWVREAGLLSIADGVAYFEGGFRTLGAARQPFEGLISLVDSADAIVVAMLAARGRFHPTGRLAPLRLANMRQPRESTRAHPGATRLAQTQSMCH